MTSLQGEGLSGARAPGSKSGAWGRWFCRCSPRPPLTWPLGGRGPIQYALTWPEHTASNLPPLDLAALPDLSFERPDELRFPSLGFARVALDAGGAMPAILNAANEIAFERFRAGTIRFTDIWRIVERTMNALGRCGDETLDAVLEADARAREYARRTRSGPSQGRTG